MINLNAISAKLANDRILPLHTTCGENTLYIYSDNINIVTIFAYGGITLGPLFRTNEQIDPHWRRVLTAVLDTVAEVEVAHVKTPDQIDAQIERLEGALMLRKLWSMAGEPEHHSFVYTRLMKRILAEATA